MRHESTNAECDSIGVFPFTRIDIALFDKSVDLTQADQNSYTAEAATFSPSVAAHALGPR